MRIKNISDVRKKLEACLAAKNSIDASVHAYKKAKILVDEASQALTVAEQILKDAADAAVKQAEAKVKAVVELEQGMEDLITSIASAKDIKKGNALDTCLATREYIHKVAVKSGRLKRRAEAEAELESVYNAALASAQSDVAEKEHIYTSAVASVESARSEILRVATIIRS